MAEENEKKLGGYTANDSKRFYFIAGACTEGLPRVPFDERCVKPSRPLHAVAAACTLPPRLTTLTLPVCTHFATSLQRST